MTTLNEMTEEQYIAELESAYNFYSHSPDGQYDMFIASLLAVEYFTLTGVDLEE